MQVLQSEKDFVDEVVWKYLLAYIQLYLMLEESKQLFRFKSFNYMVLRVL